MMKVVKLTRQYNGYGFFTHRVEFIGHVDTRVRQWIRVRNWLWNQFGASAEQPMARAHYFDGVKPKWAWDSEKSAIYLEQEAYTMFSLKKEFWDNAENL
jgi:hypothetical protein